MQAISPLIMRREQFYPASLTLPHSEYLHTNCRSSWADPPKITTLTARISPGLLIVIALGDTSAHIGASLDCRGIQSPEPH